MSLKLLELRNAINERLFDYPILEYRKGDGMERIGIHSQYNNEHFRNNHYFDDLYIIGENNALFSDRAIKFISEIAQDMGLTVKFHYRQCFTIGEV